MTSALHTAIAGVGAERASLAIPRRHSTNRLFGRFIVYRFFREDDSRNGKACGSNAARLRGNAPRAFEAFECCVRAPIWRRAMRASSFE
ncbi:alpha/beta hydrolase family domain protein [Burkholderia sp. ABCPW 111]|nr:alpha/beta hydrolase family domain protein [Burkholderia sp. ABCPW 111]